LFQLILLQKHFSLGSLGKAVTASPFLELLKRFKKESESSKENLF